LHLVDEREYRPVTVLEINEGSAGLDWVIRPAGELDMSTASELDQRIVTAMRDRPTGHVIVDLEEVEFMDSAGLRMLLTAAAVARTNGNRLLLRRPRRAVRRLIEVTGTGALLPFE
jgi:anti-anti-sigma factor